MLIRGAIHQVMTRAEVIDHTWTDDPSSDQLVDQLGQLVIFHQGQVTIIRPSGEENKPQNTRGSREATSPFVQCPSYEDCEFWGNPLKLGTSSTVGECPVGCKSNYDIESSYDGDLVVMII